jgi:hypothetical protein
MPQRISGAILRRHRAVLIGCAVVAAVCAFAMRLVKTNFVMSDYLPKDAPSTVALGAMEKSFSQPIPNLTIAMQCASIPEALDTKRKIAAVPDVLDVLWLDDAADVLLPLEMQDSDEVEAWYKDGYARFSVTVDKAKIKVCIDALETLLGSRALMAGEALNLSVAQRATGNELPKIILFVVPLVILVLLLTSHSWFDPILFMLTIGFAILLNEGTNALIGQVSFITKSTAAILQLAVSMDYAVFLLHRFESYRAQGFDSKQAMAKAVSHSFSAIAASAMTTVVGFLVLALMRFRIGPDMGIVLAKGIAFSFLSVMVLLPALTVASLKWIDALRHRSLLPSFERFGGFVVKTCIPIALIVCVLIVPGFIGQRNNRFVYGSSGMNSANSKIKADADTIDATFGKSVQMVLLVPEGDFPREEALSQTLLKIPHVTSVVSYLSAVGAEIPPEFLPLDVLSRFRGGGFDRLILAVNTNDEGVEAFFAVEEVRSAVGVYYPSGAHLIGPSVINYDLKDTIVKDNSVVTIAVILAIFLVLLLTFRSAFIPLILLFAIEGATWINLCIPFFMGSSLNYLGYLIISSVQLGCTVDYGILFTQQYTAFRKIAGKREAVKLTVADTAASILTPAGILAIAGFMLGFISTNGIISELGAILGRGGILSSLTVLLALPGLLLVFDKLVVRKPKIQREEPIH